MCFLALTYPFETGLAFRTNRFTSYLEFCTKAYILHGRKGVCGVCECSPRLYIFPKKHILPYNETGNVKILSDKHFNFPPNTLAVGQQSPGTCIGLLSALSASDRGYTFLKQRQFHVSSVQLKKKTKKKIYFSSQWHSRKVFYLTAPLVHVKFIKITI